MPDDHGANDAVSGVLNVSLRVRIDGLTSDSQTDLAHVLALENPNDVNVSKNNGLTLYIACEDISKTRALVNSTLKWAYCSNKVRDLVSGPSQ